MVKIRVTVTVLPEDVYLAAQDGHLNSPARSAQARKFMVSCESPDTWTIGQFANKVKDAFSKTYRGEDLGTIKYIKDEDDADLHTDLSVYDALVNAGAEAMNIRDQRTKITIIQQHGFPLRGDSVMPDLSASQYQIPLPPPPPPLFSNSLQAQSNERKRSSDAAFGGDDFSVHRSGIPLNQRPRLAMISSDNAEYAPVKSVEHGTPEGDDLLPNHRREVSVDMTQDSQSPIIRRAANVGHKMGDYGALADVEPKPESPDTQVPLERLNPTSRFSLEVPETAYATSQNAIKQTASTQKEGQDEARTRRQSARDYTPILPSRQSPASRRDVPQATASMAEVSKSGSTENAYLQKEAHLQIWHRQSNAPITPPSDVSPADMRGRLTLPTPKPMPSSARATSASNRFKTTGRCRDVFEPQSSIEDSQMSPRSKKKGKPDVDREAHSANKVRDGSRTMSKAGKAKVPFSETAQLCDRDTPMVSGQSAGNEPVYDFSENPSFLGDTNDYRHQNYQGTVRYELGPAVAAHDTLDDELSTDQSLADSQEKKEYQSKASSSSKHRHSPPAPSDGELASLIGKRSGSVDDTDNDSNKENHLNSRNKRSSAMQLHEPIVDAEMEVVSLEEEVDLSTSEPRRPNEDFAGVEISRKGKKLPTDSRNEDLTTIDILNGGGLRRDMPDLFSEISKSRQILGTVVQRSGETQDNAGLAPNSTATRRRRKKKSQIEGNASQIEPGTPLVDADLEKDEPEADFPNSRHGVLGEAWDRPRKRKARSDAETPTSTGSAGNQLQDNLQASTQERTESPETTNLTGDNARFSLPSLAEADSCPIRNKVYEGVVRDHQGSSAVVELRGVKGNARGLLHRNGASLKPLSGSISQILPLEEVIKVKVTSIKANKGSDAFVKLSMLNIDQVTGEFVQSSLSEHQKGTLQPMEDRRSLSSEHESPKTAAHGADAANFQIQPDVSQAPKADIEDGPTTTLNEPHRDAPQELVGTGASVNNDDDVETTRVVERAGTPENQGLSEPYFGLGFTDTPRKSKKRAANAEEAESYMVPTATPRRSNQEQTLIEPKDAPSADARGSGHQNTGDATTAQNGAKRKVSAPQWKKESMKSNSKTKLGKKQSKSQDSTERAEAGNHVSRNQSSLSLGETASLLTRPAATAKMEVAAEEYVAFPSTMTREQFLAQRKANAEAIARRNAAAAGESGAATSSGPTRGQPVTQSAKSAIKQQKDKLIDRRALQAASETLPTVAQTAHKATTKSKQHMIDYTNQDVGQESLKHDQKYSRSERDRIGVQQRKNGGALSKKAKEAAKSQEVEPAFSMPSALESQATTTPTPSRSTSPSPTKACKPTPYSTMTKPSLKPKAHISETKAQVAKPVTVKPTQARTPFNSKALSLAELKARKEAAKISTKASSRSWTPYKSTPTSSALQTALTFGTDSDSSESASESESSSDDKRKKTSGAAVLEKKAFQKAVSRPDPTIRDRSVSVDIDDDDESD